MVKTCVVRLRVIKGPNAHEQIAFCAFHLFLILNKAGYMPCMRDSNLQIRIAGSSCCLQQETHAFCRLSDRLTLGELSRP